MFFPPFLIFFAFVFLFLLFMAFGLIQVGLVSWAFARIGIPPEYLFSILFLCIVGSLINIPIRKIRLEPELDEWDTVSFFGMRFRPPRSGRRNEMVLAVNLGGAVIPTALSLYLWLNSPHPVRMLFALAGVVFVVYKCARPVAGIGIAVPWLIPPIVAALAAMIFDYSSAAPTAYFAGTLGTLIGADILHLDKLKELRAPVASIGGAGTFDGIFLAGIIAVLLSPVMH
ncbi:MAG: DUF1614 domain-containing protein [Deltaproteobacteria bacterium]|jgi:uncharacterized membrane protein|nr:DUF1614 domain-containing protein [Deltaproteobacteria bacterium]MDA8307322.1 DUF1614 domain-containing protein [Deltaproteobacteria bacterium]